MRPSRRPGIQAPREATALALAVTVALTAGAALLAQEPREGFRFRSGVELINVTATVTDSSGRFVRGLTREAFTILEDGRGQPITHFNAERVPVSLGIAIDTSGSMAGEKWDAAREALDRFLFELLDAEDEVFLYRFNDAPDLVEGWTTDRQRLSRALGRISPKGGTALYDTVAEAVPMAHSGKHRKKALLVISDGNDTSSTVGPSELKRLVQETEVLVYAIGIDGQGDTTWTNTRPRFPVPGRGPTSGPYPVPGRRPPGYPPGYPPNYPPQPRPPSGGGGSSRYGRGDERVNVSALRSLTDDSGGRTEIIRSARDLNPATASIADELSQQYYLAYAAPGARDGRWHAIEVQVADARSNGQIVNVRHRRGYVAVP
jgi:VWFA-related protein